MKKEEENKKEAEKRAPGKPLQELSAHREDKKHKGASKNVLIVLEEKMHLVWLID